MSKKKLLYIAPHLSTGGQPQYLYKQVKYFHKDFEIEVVEINNSGGNAFVVQKNRIKELVPVHTLGEDKSKILEVINEFKPDIIHFQEIPQFDLAPFILDQIFNKDRKHFILATTHGSYTNPSEIVYQPDRYVLVSEWSKKRFEDAELGVELDVWEYPIEKYEFDKSLAKQELGLDPTWKHILNVGLFSPGKNQGEIFAIARQLEKYKIKFHFVGNQAMNYEDYWKPLMQYKPDNCIVWGERNDVDKFYEACDMFYFSSKLELNPLSIKEALSFELPSIFRKLHTYLDTYDDNPLVTYINDDLKITKRVILETLQPEFNEIPGWFAYEDLYNEMVENANGGETFVEVGAWLGKSTNHLVTKIKESGKDIKFTAVDTWKGTEDEDLHQNIVNAYSGDIFYEFIDNTVLSNNFGIFETIKDTSHNAANQFTNSSIDFIMIDAGHSYKDVMDDIHFWYNKVKPGGIISGDDYGVFSGVTQAANEYFYGQFKEGFRSWIRKKPRIQIKHLLTRPDDMRERVSIQSLKQLEKYGIHYEQVVNKPYEGLAPAENCRRPEHISKDNKPGELYPGAGLGWMTGRHYGCYMAHRGALETMDTENFDYTLVFEADAFIYTGIEEFVEIVHRACFLMERDDVYFMGLADNPSQGKDKIDELFSKTAFNQDLAHAYIIPNKTKNWWLDRIKNCGWDVGDLWFNHVFYNHPKNRYTTNKVYSKQAEGFSLLDLTVKTWS
jgi:predicted O-methyltransferase YrrM